ncbi:thiol-disulfide oxidoreductase DCC family protein [Gaetbulibacter aestuarii]|uniref:DCC1-like thiol-disulfide oxidoreductase family protein n=1 Tax=Gaetbulibacter aestuarii TaxID=1502358 RepID=A0ABW7MZH0_9FLAO
MIKLPQGKYLILFDGVCNLCNSSIQYVIKYDKKNQFMFTALQSNTGKALIERFNIDTQKTDSVLLYTPEKGLDYKSTAALKVAYRLGFPHALWCVFFIVPTFLRNWIYDFIARNRYKWFGKKAECMVPTPELKAKFLE